MRDIFSAGHVKILIDEFGRRVWVCVNGVTELRLGRINTLELEDLRLNMSEKDSAWDALMRHIRDQYEKETGKVWVPGSKEVRDWINKRLFDDEESFTWNRQDESSEEDIST